MKRAISGVVVGVLAAALLVGCKGVDQRMTRLDYMPTKPAAATSGPAVAVAMPADASGLPRNAGGEPLVADVVTKGGKKRANVVVVESIPKWVGNAVTGELRAAGVNAALGMDAAPGRTVVKTEIEQIRNATDSKWSSGAVDTTIMLKFRVERDGRELGTAESTGQAHVQKAAEFKDVVQMGMEQALRDCLIKAMPRLAELVAR